MLTLGVPTLNRYDLLELLFVTAEQGELVPDRYIVIDNGGGLGMRAWMPAHKTELITPGKNLGVAISWNEIIRRSEDWCVVVNDDVQLHANTLSQMVKTAEETDADFVFPAPNFGGARMFSCFLFRKRLEATVGLFDEGFWPCCYEDNDLHYRMKLAGSKEATAPCGYGHDASATSGGVDPWSNRIRYLQKWGGDPGQERFTIPFEKKW